MAADDEVAPRLDDRSFARLQAVVRERCGIVLGTNKRQLCQTRLLRRLRLLGLRTFAEYLAVLDDPHAREQDELVNAITTNVTSFYREPHHFEWLAQRALPALARERGRTRLRLWSAGCSSGEEPWTLAMTVAEARLPAGWDVKILGTDIDTQVLATAEAGVYPDARLERVSPARRKQHFVRGSGGWQVAPQLRAMVRFRELNLFDAWPMSQPFDVIFCRNVIIYFDAEAKHRLVQRFTGALLPGGHLVLGHSESLLREVPGLAAAGKTVYQRAPK